MCLVRTCTVVVVLCVVVGGSEKTKEVEKERTREERCCCWCCFFVRWDVRNKNNTYIHVSFSFLLEDPNLCFGVLLLCFCVKHCHLMCVSQKGLVQKW